MRRRITNAARAEGELPPVAFKTEPPLPKVAKGHCPKCGKHVGKGLYMHTKVCGVK